ncbi:VENN motif pre-toxin domain-containing protein, partial [Pasteurellaceae bacterium LIM206]|nr:VENN motif pre-toxin domain-containing protein [Pasteurellaceae bacterium LIM206]
TKTANDLTEAQKNTITVLSQLAGGLAGGLLGDSTQSAVLSSEVSKRAVEDNFSLNQSADYYNGLAQAETAKQILTDTQKAVIDKFEREHPDIIAGIKTGADVISLLSDFTPVVGDIKSFVEAEDAIDYTLAVIGVIPGADAVTKPLKEIKETYQAAKKAAKAGDIAKAEAYLKDASKQIDRVKALDVDSYVNLQKRSVVGDGLDLDHIPSFAALKKAKEIELGRKLTPNEERVLRNEATAIAVPGDVHNSSRTYKGRNTKAQVELDANNLCVAQLCDIGVVKANLKAKGYSDYDINNAINKIIERNKLRGIEK